ncbi:unnamed protein product [Cuscuta epithymum]|uniref:Uncharacterized protein n=1 Tax=Cuscuta epithymum TaxID=186058 RepID=A0AAV0FZH7_9ASTE|nr:unnamed protein product [Cuscuta epithymum]
MDDFRAFVRNPLEPLPERSLHPPFNGVDLILGYSLPPFHLRVVETPGHRLRRRVTPPWRNRPQIRRTAPFLSVHVVLTVPVTLPADDLGFEVSAAAALETPAFLHARLENEREKK